MAEGYQPPPDEDQLAEMLRDFQPRPSERFYRRMENAPWMRKPLEGAWPGSGIRRSRVGFPYQVLGAIALVILLVGVLYLVSPTLQATARQVVAYFLPESSDHIAVPVTIPLPAGPEDYGTRDLFSLSLAEAEEAAGFLLRMIDASSLDLTFSGARYQPDIQAVTQRYVNNEGIVLFTQRKLGEVQEYASIGVSAPVETIHVRGVSGEYVTGGWREINEGTPALTTSPPGTQVDLEAVWDSELPQHTLRWQEGEMLYEILSSGLDLDKEQLIWLANGLK